MPINLKNTSIIKANWNNKSENIKSISKELNLGLDSFVFIDDSEFEISEVKNKLPMVKTFSVPKDIYNYPNFFRKNITKLFNNKNLTLEDKKRVNYYKYEINRKKHSAKFKNREKFIDSLNLRLKVYINKQNKNYTDRISQMTQKTNQFNLTTKRYTEDDIKNFINIKSFHVFTGDVSDKFGDHGKTILTIIKKEKKSFIIDTFLMSCRVIGRELEKSFFDAILKKIKNDKLPIYGTYIKTEKNEQVKSFYQKLGFSLLSENKNSANYILDTKKLNYKSSSRKIKIVYGK
jgi:FkbH-like protein